MFQKIRARRAAKAVEKNYKVLDSAAETTSPVSIKSIFRKGATSPSNRTSDKKTMPIFRKISPAEAPVIELSRTVGMTEDEDDASLAVSASPSPSSSSFFKSAEFMAPGEDGVDDASLVVSASPMSSSAIKSIEFLGEGEILAFEDTIDDTVPQMGFGEQLQKNYEESLAVKELQIHLTKKELMLARIELSESHEMCTSLANMLAMQQEATEEIEGELYETKEKLQTVSSALIHCQHELFEKEEASTMTNIIDFGKGGAQAFMSMLTG